MLGGLGLGGLGLGLGPPPHRLLPFVTAPLVEFLHVTAPLVELLLSMTDLTFLPFTDGTGLPLAGPLGSRRISGGTA